MHGRPVQQVERLAATLEESFNELSKVPPSVYTYAPGAYIEKSLTSIAMARKALEECEKDLVASATMCSLVPQRRLAKASGRPTSTIARWKKEGLKEE